MKGRVCIMSQKKYNQEFKQTVFELYRSGTSVSQLSSECGVSEVTIYKWIKQHSPIQGTQELTVLDVMWKPSKRKIFD